MTNAEVLCVPYLLIASLCLTNAAAMHASPSLNVCALVLGPALPLYSVSLRLRAYLYDARSGA